MLALLAIMLSFPTIVYTVLLGVVLLYWLFVILGALHIDALGSGDVGHGGLEGAGHGGLEGAGHGGLDGAGHGGADGTDAGGDGAGDDVDVGHGGIASAIAALRLRSVPATVMMSFLVTFSWLASVFAIQALNAFAPSSAGVFVRFLVLVASLLVALPITSVVIRPLAPLFAHRQAKGKQDLIGKVCVVRTGSVDDKFGEATLEDGGAGLVLRVRVDRGEQLGRGDQALIVAYDEERETFTVAPMEEMMRDKERS
jgi:hypothetical protein